MVPHVGKIRYEEETIIVRVNNNITYHHTATRTGKFVVSLNEFEVIKIYSNINICVCVCVCLCCMHNIVVSAYVSIHFSII